MSVTWGTVLLLIVGLFSLINGLMVVTLSLVWLERKFLGRLQSRVGPTRVGPFGLLQPVADAVKLLFKENVSPGVSARAIFFMSPVFVFVPSFVIWLTIPFGQGLVIRDLELGLFFLIGFSVLSIVGLVLAGWSSSSKYAILGGFRAGAQLISYEVPIIMAIASIVILTGTMNITDVVEGQSRVPYAAVLPISLVVFLIAGIAEVGRTPFDIYFAESEVVGGPFVEYSGAHWAVFFLAEYVNTFVISALISLLFLGGWVWPFDSVPPAVGALFFLAKTYIVVLFIFWLRATYPRMRIDQLMGFGWKVLIPLSFGAVTMVAVQQFYGWPLWTLTAMSLLGLAIPVCLQVRIQRQPSMERARRYAERAIAERKGAS